MFKSYLGWLALLVLLAAQGFAQDAPAADPARSLLGKLELNEITEFKACETYQEAPSLKALVDQGLLPPVEERLPKVPKMYKNGMMVDGPGVYGDVHRDTFAVPVQSWNWGAGQTQGWFGINETVQSQLVELYPMWMMKEPSPVPELATSWEWSEDGLTLTMKLMEGVKWSDGDPFDAEDVVFTWNNYILDDNIPSWSRTGDWTFGGKVTEVAAVDDYTVTFTFGAPFPISALYKMGYLNGGIVPSHVFKPLHPAFNPDTTYAEFLSLAAPTDLPFPSLGPFVPVRYEPGQQLVLVRNPYYFIIDENCQQLPYRDEVIFAEATSGEQRSFNLISDAGDADNVENPQIYGAMFEASQKPDAHINLRFEGFGIGFRIEPNYSLNAGIQSPRDTAVRTLFRDLEFRKALSQALDRTGIASAAFPGPLTQGWQGGYPSGSPFYDASAVTSYEYNPDASRQILADLGFSDTNGDGILNWPADNADMAGQELILELLVSGDQSAQQAAAEAIQALYRDVGIDLRINVLDGATKLDQRNASQFDLSFERVDSSVPDKDPNTFGPASAESPAWHRPGPEGRELMPFEEEMAALFDEAKFTADANRRKEIFTEILRLSTENIYTIGVYEARRGLGMHKRVQNVADDMPTYLYEWGLSYTYDYVWTPADQQFPVRFTDLIPTAEDYQNRFWNSGN
jgi:peptide/nickel transport system substrate-binding protein